MRVCVFMDGGGVSEEGGGFKWVGGFVPVTSEARCSHDSRPHRVDHREHVFLVLPRTVGDTVGHEGLRWWRWLVVQVSHKRARNVEEGSVACVAVALGSPLRIHR